MTAETFYEGWASSEPPSPCPTPPLGSDDGLAQAAAEQELEAYDPSLHHLDQSEWDAFFDGDVQVQKAEVREGHQVKDRSQPHPPFAANALPKYALIETRTLKHFKTRRWDFVLKLVRDARENSADVIVLPLQIEDENFESELLCNLGTSLLICEDAHKSPIIFKTGKRIDPCGQRDLVVMETSGFGKLGLSKSLTIHNDKGWEKLKELEAEVVIYSGESEDESSVAGLRSRAFNHKLWIVSKREVIDCAGKIVAREGNLCSLNFSRIVSCVSSANSFEEICADQSCVVRDVAKAGEGFVFWIEAKDGRRETVQNILNKHG